MTGHGKEVKKGYMRVAREGKSSLNWREMDREGRGKEYRGWEREGNKDVSAEGRDGRVSGKEEGGKEKVRRVKCQRERGNEGPSRKKIDKEGRKRT